jgi:MFS family permease
MPFIAAISDAFGRRPCLLASVFFFAIGTILCSAARGIALVLVGRALQGVGGGGIIVLSLVVFTDLVPLRFRPKWYGTVYVCGQLSAAAQTNASVGSVPGR